VFILTRIERNKLASMIYGVSRNIREGVAFSSDTPYESPEVLEKPMKSSCFHYVYKRLYSHGVPKLQKLRF